MEQGRKPVLWGGKRFFSLNYFLRKKFQEKVFKIPLDAGFTCPNRDGKLAYGGCAFCSPRGSGDFAAGRHLPLSEQFVQGKEMMHKKWKKGKYILYFQAFTNTYAPISHLRKTFTSLLHEPGVVGIAISTRPDCMDQEIMALLEEIKQTHYLWVELGLQTVHARTAERMNMHYGFADFLETLYCLRERQIETCAHIILGLPGETRNEMLETASQIARLPLQGVKIHMLHLMKETPLAQHYHKQAFPLLSLEEYVDVVVDILEILPPDMVIHRLTGDSPRENLITPQWSLDKWQVLNQIDRYLVRRDTWQGKHHRDLAM